MIKLQHGYPKGIDYLKSVYNKLSPASMNYCLNLAGWRGIALENNFTYAELGAGFGLSTAGWSAQYPQGKFYCVDYHPAHASWALNLGKQAELDNFHVFGASIGEMLKKDLPHFDFVVLHGLYSWVDDSVRADIKTFLDSFVKPGGCVYISYNTLPGFVDVEPMREVVNQVIRTAGTSDPAHLLELGLKTLSELQSNGSAFFNSRPKALQRLTSWLEKNDKAYLTAELLTNTHRAFYFGELYSEMKMLGFEWAASSNVIDFLEQNDRPKALRSLLGTAAKDIILHETLKDNFYSTEFRNDLFIRSPSGPEPVKASQELVQIPLCLNRIHHPLPAEATNLNFHAKMDMNIYALQAFLSYEALSLENLCQVLLQALPKVKVDVSVLMALDWLMPGPANAGREVTERVRRLNMVLESIDSGNEALTMPLLSATGGWLPTDDTLFYLNVMAKLQDLDFVQHAVDRLWKGENEDMELRKQLAVFAEQSALETENFMRRHKLLPA